MTDIATQGRQGAMDESNLSDRLRQVIDLARGDAPDAKVLVAAHLVGSDRRWTVGANRVVPAASTIKTAILVALYRAVDAGALTLDDRYPVDASARVPGSGVLTWMRSDLVLSLADLAYLMIAVSDNTASNLVLGALGLERVQATIAELGMHRTKLRRPFLGRSVAPGEPDNLTCAADLVTLMSAVAAGTATTPASCARMRDTLALQQDRGRLARFLPAAARFAGKSGSLDDIVHDSGLLDTPSGPLAVAVLTRGFPDPYAAETLIGRIAEVLLAEVTTGAAPERKRAAGEGPSAPEGYHDPTSSCQQARRSRFLHPSHRGGRRAFYLRWTGNERSSGAGGVAQEQHGAIRAMTGGAAISAGVETGCGLGRGQPTRVTFDDLLVRHCTEIYRYTMNLTRNSADADDLYQDTMIKAYRAFNRLDDDANHRAWLYRIATNAFLSDRRKRGREEQLDDTRADSIPGAPTDDAARIDARDLLDDVERFVQTLPVKQRAAVIQRKYHDLSYAEIAANLRCTETAARASVHEALRKLRERFGERL